MYILDEYQSKITIFDTEGKFVGEFGRSGQGPNEFFMPETILIRNGRIYVFHGRTGGQYKVLDLAGKFVLENFAVIENRQKIKSIRDEFYVMRAKIQRTLENLFFVLTINDETLSKEKEIFRIRYPYGLIGPNYEFIWSKWLLILRDGCFYYPEDNFHKYSLIKYDREGTPISKFGIPYDSAPYSAAAKKRFYKLYSKAVERKMLSFPHNPPIIVNMFQDDSGCIWVVSGETYEDNLIPEFENTIDIFNAKGEWLSSFRTKLISKQTLYHAGRVYRVLPINEETYIQMIEVYKIKYLI